MQYLDKRKDHPGVKSMGFVRYESFREYIKFYPVTSALLFLNLLLFIIVSFSGGSRDLYTLVQFGALIGGSFDVSDTWRYFASMFLHSGFDHLLFNSFALFIFAPTLERILGSFKYIVLYIGSGITGNAASMLFLSEGTVSVGASGAIFGIYGAYIYMLLYRKDLLDLQSRKTVQVILIIGVIYTILVPKINIYAHFGGLVGGLLLFAMLIKVNKGLGR
jgi:rhomboid protease GluP